MLDKEASKNIVEFIRLTLRRESKVYNTIKYVFVGDKAPLKIDSQEITYLV